MGSRLLYYYDKVVLRRPWFSLLFVALVLIFFGLQIKNFKLDASAESLVLENDEALRYYRSISKIYSSNDFLVITYTPFEDIMSENSLADLKTLRDELSQLERVESVVTILDVPLLNSPNVKISKLSTEMRTLQTPGLDKELARKEFLESPIYRKLMMSLDAKTTVLQVIFKRDETYFSLLNRRTWLKEKTLESGLTVEESDELNKVIRKFKEHHAIAIDKQRQDIEAVRQIMDKHRNKAEMFLGGISMIVADMISFIEHDLAVFGFGVLCFLILALFFFFRKLRWIILPLSCCTISAVVMVGFLGFVDWRVTVISSNFTSLMLIITMALTIHLIVRYRDSLAETPDLDQKTLVLDMVGHMATPCFYTAVTTIVAFCSLVVSGIRPVIDFGWMMTIGIAVAFSLNFIFFPAALVLLSPEKAGSSADPTKELTLAIASFTQKNYKGILFFSFTLAIFSVIGILKLEVENRFIDNFKSTTEIYKGMKVIDTQLGGTTPLEIIIDPDKDFFDFLKELELEEKEELDDEFKDEFEGEEKQEEPNYWFHPDMLLKVEKIHDYLDSLSVVGKVQSIATSLKVFRTLNDGKMPDDFDLAVLRKKMIPENVKKTLVSPYLSEDANQVRITMRLMETDPNLKRKALINKINRFLVEEMNFSEEDVHFTGMAVLYNNMLQSLYRSQILTIGTVFIAILIMFIILFRNIYLSFIAIIPNILAAGLVLGIMGWVGIPLDMMTITIAAITIGIAVDDSIHYIYRFKVEFVKDHDYRATLNRCHGSIGKAIYYTSITVTVGFSILALSDFIPTLYFGLLTGLAMLVALMNNLTLLPILIVLFKPLGRELEN